MPNWKKLIVSGSDAHLNSLSVTENVTAASLTGSFTGSFVGDGSGIENLDIFGVTQSFLSPVPFTDKSSVVVSHNLNIEYPVVQVYDSNDIQLIPNEVKSIDNNTIEVTFTEETSGFIVVMKGGHILGSFGTFGGNFTNETIITVNHNLDTPSPFVQVYDDNSEQLIPELIKIINNNTVRVEFPEPQSGQVIVTRGGHNISLGDFLDDFDGEIQVTSTLSASYVKLENVDGFPEYSSSVSEFIGSVSTTSKQKQILGSVSGNIDINLDDGTLVEFELEDDVTVSFSPTDIDTNTFIDFTLKTRGQNLFNLLFQEEDILPIQEISTSTTERSLLKGQYLGNNQSIFSQLIPLKDFNEYVDGDYVDNYFI